MVPDASLILGWEEWVALPGLGLPSIKAKVDTGARTSALHAHLIEPFGPADAPMVRFVVNPVPGRDDIEITCSAPVIDQREVISSNGDREIRFVIEALLSIGGRDWPIELTLTNRASMTFRMLLGRRAIREDVFVDPTSSFRQPRLSYKPYRRMPRRDPVRRALRLGILTRKPEAASVQRLRTAAAARGHVLDLLDLDHVALMFENGAPGITIRGKTGPHYDAIIPRVGTRGEPFAATTVRQLELMGCFAVNPGDALDRVRDPIAVIQELTRAGLPVRAPPFEGTPKRQRSAADNAPASFRLLVVGGKVAAVVRRRNGRTRKPQAGDLSVEMDLAARAAVVLRLGLATVDIVRDAGAPVIAAVSAVPALSRIEDVAGVDVAGRIIALIESRVRARAGAMAAESPKRT